MTDIRNFTGKRIIFINPRSKEQKVIESEGEAKILLQYDPEREFANVTLKKLKSSILENLPESLGNYEKTLFIVNDKLARYLIRTKYFEITFQYVQRRNDLLKPSRIIDENDSDIICEGFERLGHCSIDMTFSRT